MPATAPLGTRRALLLLLFVLALLGSLCEAAPRPASASSSLRFHTGEIFTPAADDVGSPVSPVTPVTPVDTPLPDEARIHDIQGAAHVSPYSGTLVMGVPGIVTAIRSAGGTRGFYMQDPEPDQDERTSEGVFVFTGSTSTPTATVSVGQFVVVTGTVSEFRPSSRPNDLSGTQIGSPGLEILVASGSSPSVILPTIISPTATFVAPNLRVPPQISIEDDTTGSVEDTSATTFDPASDGIDFYESLEGMLVQLNDALVVGPTSTFNETNPATLNREIPVVSDNGATILASQRTARGGVIIGDDYSTFNPQRIFLSDNLRGGDAGDPALPTLNVGDRLNGAFNGVIDYSFANFKLLNIDTTLPLSVTGGLQKEALSFTSGLTDQLSVATFNVENLAPNAGSAKFGTLATTIVSNLGSPDIIALEEVQDNNGATNDSVVAADQTYQALIAAISTAGGPSYQFRQIDPVDDQDGGQGGGNIRVGLLFNPQRVSFVDRPGGTSTNATVAIRDSASRPSLRYSPGRIDPTNAAFASSRKPLAGEFVFQGQTVFVIANHFSSKGGDQPLYGRFQPPARSSEVNRIQQAAIVNSFVDSILALDATAKVIVLGDINDFEFSQVAQTLEGSVLTSLIKTLPKNQRYTYTFEGNAQVLDHILVTRALLNRLVGYDVVHVNAEFADQVSDHDPQVAIFGFVNERRFPIVGRNFSQ